MLSLLYGDSSLHKMLLVVIISHTNNYHLNFHILIYRISLYITSGESSSIVWDTRFRIIKGICEGINFLHTLIRPVLHLGLKPQNIMLDANMSPKIGDFGFSRIFGNEQTRRITQSVVGSV